MKTINFYEPITNKYYETFKLEYNKDSISLARLFLEQRNRKIKTHAGPDGSVIFYNEDGTRHMCNTGSCLVFRKGFEDRAFVESVEFFAEMLEV